MFTLNRRNNGQYLAIVPTAMDSPRKANGARLAAATLYPPVRKNQAVKTPEGFVVISKQAFDYAMWAPASATKARVDFTVGRLEAYWTVAKLDFTDAISAIKKRFSKGDK